VCTVTYASLNTSEVSLSLHSVYKCDNGMIPLAEYSLTYRSGDYIGTLIKVLTFLAFYLSFMYQTLQVFFFFFLNQLENLKWQIIY